MATHEAITGIETSEAYELYGPTLRSPEQLDYPQTPEDVDRLLLRLDFLAKAGHHIAIVDGAYDVPHPGHERYLIEYRIKAAQNALGHEGMEWSQIPRDKQLDIIASELVTLVVTVDADAKVRAKKSTAEKGGIVRPVYGWEARAQRITGYTIPDSKGYHRPVVDIATVEGDTDHIGTALESHLAFGYELAERGILGSWVFYGEHSDALSAVTATGIETTVISHTTFTEIDPMTNQPWHSSDIIRRIRGES